MRMGLVVRLVTITVAVLISSLVAMTTMVGASQANHSISPARAHTAPGGHGYWLVGSDGGVFAFGGAQFYGSTGSLRLQRPIVSIAATRDGGGYWLVASDGGIFSFGDAGFYGSIPGLGIAPAGSTDPGPKLNAPIVGMVPSTTGEGYFLVASDGGVFAFGDARFEGSCPGIGGCGSPVVAVQPDASGNGYWVATSLGPVYRFGDDPGSCVGEPPLELPPGVVDSVTSAVNTADDGGCYILYASGSVANSGDAALFPGQAIEANAVANPATAIVATDSLQGFWVFTANGGVFAHGDAPNDGDMTGTTLNGSIIAAAGW
jgi:hypothetical protein